MQYSLRSHRLLPLILILALTSLIHPSLSDPIGCFAQSPAWKRQLVSTTFKACYGISKFLISHDKSDAAIIFSRRPGAGFQVPHAWTNENCALVINMHADEDEDRLSFKDIAVEAGAIMVRCVARPPHFGGTHAVGPRKVMNVTVHGVERQKHDGGWGIAPVVKVDSTGDGATNATTNRHDWKNITDHCCHE